MLPEALQPRLQQGTPESACGGAETLRAARRAADGGGVPWGRLWQAPGIDVQGTAAERCAGQQLEFTGPHGYLRRRPLPEEARSGGSFQCLPCMTGGEWPTAQERHVREAARLLREPPRHNFKSSDKESVLCVDDVRGQHLPPRALQFQSTACTLGKGGRHGVAAEEEGRHVQRPWPSEGRRGSKRRGSAGRWPRRCRSPGTHGSGLPRISLPAGRLRRRWHRRLGHLQAQAKVCGEARGEGAGRLPEEGLLVLQVEANEHRDGQALQACWPALGCSWGMREEPVGRRRRRSAASGAASAGWTCPCGTAGRCLGLGLSRGIVKVVCPDGGSRSWLSPGGTFAAPDTGGANSNAATTTRAVSPPPLLLLLLLLILLSRLRRGPRQGAHVEVVGLPTRPPGRIC
mmetsp:Transcript_35679/g.111328  ORF Transcript_35679/g.111328 Transcript_35679/m.111328 type:complete len:402 (+) Transcript_35679:1863-3068(+)